MLFFQTCLKSFYPTAGEMLKFRIVTNAVRQIQVFVSSDIGTHAVVISAQFTFVFYLLCHSEFAGRLWILSFFSGISSGKSQIRICKKCIIPLGLGMDKDSIRISTVIQLQSEKMFSSFCWKKVSWSVIIKSSMSFSLQCWRSTFSLTSAVAVTWRFPGCTKNMQIAKGSTRIMRPECLLTWRPMMSVSHVCWRPSQKCQTRKTGEHCKVLLGSGFID